MENLASLTEMLNYVVNIVRLQIQIVILGFTASRLNVSVIVKRSYVDVETGEVFKVSRGLRGVRLFIISKLV